MQSVRNGVAARHTVIAVTGAASPRSPRKTPRLVAPPPPSQHFFSPSHHPPLSSPLPSPAALSGQTWTRSLHSSSRHLQLAMSSAASSNPRTRPDFKVVESSRPPFDESKATVFTKTVRPDWKFGDGANHMHAEKNASSSSSSKSHIVIDPCNHDRPPGSIYKLIISGVCPRPIAFVSSLSADGKVHNLAPFSYFNVMSHDPPLFALGVTGNLENPKDTLRNLVESRECVINIISEHFVEAANSTSIDAPYGSSEWDVSGLTPDYSTETVAAPRVREAIFSIEAKVESIREFESKARPGVKSTVVVLLEGSRLWVREDALDTEDPNVIDPAVLRPISRLAGVSYGRTNEIFEIPRPQFEKDLGGKVGFDRLERTKTQNEVVN